VYVYIHLSSYSNFLFFVLAILLFIFYFFREALISGVGGKIAADFPKKGADSSPFCVFRAIPTPQKKGHKKKNARG
jgi:hypothetical protein